MSAAPKLPPDDQHGSSHAYDAHGDSGVLDIHGGGGSGHGSGSHEGGEEWLISYADLMTLLVGFFVILLSFSQVDQEKMEGLKKAMTQTFGGTYEQPYSEMARKIRDKLDKLGLGSQVVVKQTDSGVEISFLGTVFFVTGSADMKENGRAILDQVIPAMKEEGGDFDIIIEGHTDDVPVSGSGFFRTNWELSSLRACRVLQAFFDFGGFQKEHMTAVGYGDSKPSVPNRDKDGVAIPENQSQNRRVVIRMIKRGESPLGGAAPKQGASSEAVAKGSTTAPPAPDADHADAPAADAPAAEPEH